MEFIVIIAAVALILTFVAYLRRAQPKITCPACGSVQVRQVEQQLKRIEQDTSVGYATKLDVRLIMETSYRCQNCNHTWAITAPE